MELERTPSRSGEGDEDRVPVFGSWRSIYAAVIASALVGMGLIALFSAWRY